MDDGGSLDGVDLFDHLKNESSWNTSTILFHNVTVSALSTTVVNSAIIALSAVNIALTIAVIFTLYRCKKMAFQIKRLSYNVFLSDMVINLALGSLSTLSITLGSEAYDNLKHIRICVGATGVLLSVSSIAGLTLDRLVAVTKPFVYERILSKQTVSHLTAYIWSVHSVLPITVWLVSLKLSCNLDFPRCDTMNLPFRTLLACFYVIYHSFIIGAYILMSNIARHLKHPPRIAPLQISTIEKKSNSQKKHLFPSTYAMVRIVFIFELTNFPIFVHSVLFIMFPNFQTRASVSVFQTLSYLCMCGNLYSCFFIYVWKIKECKFVFLSTFLSWSEGCREMAESLRLDIYNIVPFGGRVNRAFVMPQSAC